VVGAKFHLAAARSRPEEEALFRPVVVLFHPAVE
jgi:hypothetical protein